MSAEKPKPNPTSEILKNPVGIVDKIKTLFEHPKDKQAQEQFSKFLSEEWPKINGLISKIPNDYSDGYGVRIARHLSPNSFDDGIRTLYEECPRKFFMLKNIEPLFVGLQYESNPSDKKKDDHVHIVFAADRQKRDRLLAVSVIVDNYVKPDTVEKEVYEIKVYPKFEKQKGEASISY